MKLRSRLAGLNTKIQGVIILVSLILAIWLFWSVFLQQPKGLLTGSDLLHGHPGCAAGDQMQPYSGGAFKIYYYDSGCAKINPQNAIFAQELLADYSQSLGKLGLTPPVKPMAVLLLPGHKWSVLGTPGTSKAILVGVGNASDNSRNVLLSDYNIGAPLAAAELADAAIYLAKQPRDQLASALAALAGPTEGTMAEHTAMTRVKADGGEAGFYAWLMAHGHWPGLASAIDDCKSACNWQRSLNNAFKGKLGQLRRDYAGG